MSHFIRGMLDGVVHYCDRGWVVQDRRKRVAWPWCQVAGHKAPADPVSHKALITCLQCMYLRRTKRGQVYR